MLLNGISLALACCANYVFYWFNDWLFSGLEFTKGVNWIFLPAGINLVLVMVLGRWASVGIAISAATIKHQLFPQLELFDWVINGVMAGFGPLMALWIGEHFFHMDSNLRSRSAATLLKLAALFSIVSSTIHQLWFAFDGQSQSLVRDAPVMALGDFTGVLIFLYAFKLVLYVADTVQDKKPLI